MQSKTKLVFIGLGAANTFGLLYLLEQNHEHGKYDITVIEKGKNIDSRDKQKDILYGNIGSGLFSDNKMIFSEHPDQPLIKFKGIESLKAYDFVQKMITKFHPEPTKINITEPQQSGNYKEGWGELAMKQSLCWHVGSHYGYNVGKNIEDYLLQNNVKIINESSVTDIDNGFIYHTSGKTPYDTVFIGLGKTGKKLTEKLLGDRDLHTIKREVQVGVRFETPFNPSIQDVVKEQYDFKYSLDYDTHNIRTFCVCNNSAYVCLEGFDGQTGPRVQWNGEGYGIDNTEKRNYLTNFGIMLSYQVEDGDKFIKELESRFKGKGFVYEGESCSYKSSVDVLPGKVTKEQFHYYMGDEVSNILFDFVGKLNNILKFNGDYRMFLPEIKEVTGTIPGDKFEIYQNMFFVGDGSPVCNTRGIVPAASTGILAMKEFLGEQV